MKHDVEVKYVRSDGDHLICEVCPVLCRLREGQTGLCNGRKVIGGRLIAVNYGETVALHLDPVEKKPLYHVAPGSPIWSAGPNGCNLRCKWCQNADISQFKAPTSYFPPQDLADAAMKERSVGLACTYTEPLIWHEYLVDVMPEVKRRGGLNVIVTNGYIEEKPLRDLLPWLDAANVDLKFLDGELYRKYTGARLEPVLRSIRIMHDEGVHVELTHLVVTGLSDDLDHARKLVDWVAELDPEIPLHISRYSPRHKWKEPPTSLETLLEVYRIASRRLSFVYLGNVALEEGVNTICPDCGTLLIQREWYTSRIVGIRDSRCAGCGRLIPFVPAP